MEVWGRRVKSLGIPAIDNESALALNCGYNHYKRFDTQPDSAEMQCVSYHPRIDNYGIEWMTLLVESKKAVQVDGPTYPG
ncbi:hypothetical protein GJ496_010192 [Pomphorhynchus laevis]|nr:hypothetical protein GJ496_010192 [Pomphorhynchus laevis]